MFSTYVSSASLKAVGWIVGASLAVGLTTAANLGAAQEVVKPIQDEGVIYFLTPGQTSVRWVNNDAPNMIAALAELAPNMRLEVLDAGGDAAKQQTQMESAIAAGAKGVIITVVDSTNPMGPLQSAKGADVPVVGYAHDLTGQDMGGFVVAHITTLLLQDYHVPHCVSLGEMVKAGADWSASDQFKLALFNFSSGSGIGKIIYENCMAGLQPAIDADKLKIVCSQDLPDFTAATAQKATEQCLTAQGNDLDGVSVGNDDQSDGIFAALQAQGLAGKTMIYGGYDATLTGIQRVAGGYQDFDIYPPFRQMARVAVQALLHSINSEMPLPAEVNARYLNAEKVAEGGVPAAFLPNTRVKSDNIDETTIADKLFTKEQICQGLAAGSAYCK